MPEATASPRHEPGRQAVPLVQIPRVLLADHLLSITARGLAAIAVARGGSLHLRRDVLDVIDPVGELLEHGYAIVDGEHLVLTPVAGWGA